MSPRPFPNRRDASALCVVAALSLLACAGLLIAAVLAPAPPAVLPLLVFVCLGCPLALGWSLPASLAVLRAAREHEDDRARVMDTLRRQLDRIPETRHPLGL